MTETAASFESVVAARVAERLKLDAGVVARVLQALGRGAPAPFLARYRRQEVGGLDEATLRLLRSEAERVRELEQRREFVLRAIAERAALTEKLQRRIDRARTRVELEYLYEPFRPPRKTPGRLARERGLDPLADAWLANETPDGAAFVDAERGVASAVDALRGARDILSERFAVDPEVRAALLRTIEKEGVLSAAPGAGKGTIPDRYGNLRTYEEKIARVPSHRFLALRRAGRAAGELVGAGVAIFMEESGRGPSDNAKIKVDPDGTVELITGGASLGQGFETVMAQICAEALGVDYKRVRVIHGQTDLIDHGIGAHAARATVLTGGAVHVTATMVREKALEFASELLQTPADELDIVDGTVMRRDAKDGGPSITLGEIAKRIAPGARLLRGRAPQLAAHGWYNTDHTVFPYGVHLAVVCVDRETGKIAVERFMVAYDVGRAVNPLLIEGQLVGGCVQGLGGALSEEFVYDETGEPLSATFADYLMPTLHEVPDVEVLLTEDAPSPRHPLGLKGAGEGGINGAGGVIASAIDDALRMPGAITRLPVTPQRIRELLRPK
jgi:CO/xanthine dehydrogenase Mo-binding subunit